MHTPGGEGEGWVRYAGHIAAAGSMTNNSRAHWGTPGNHNHFSPHYSPSLTSCCSLYSVLCHSHLSLLLTLSGWLHFKRTQQILPFSSDLTFYFTFHYFLFFFAWRTQVIHNGCRGTLLLNDIKTSTHISYRHAPCWKNQSAYIMPGLPTYIHNVTWENMGGEDKWRITFTVQYVKMQRPEKQKQKHLCYLKSYTHQIWWSSHPHHIINFKISPPTNTSVSSGSGYYGCVWLKPSNQFTVI